MSEGLALCPFCGSTSNEASYSAARITAVCECSAMGPAIWTGGPNPTRQQYNAAEAEAIAAWNRRAPSPDMREAVEALTTAVHAHYVKAFEDYGIAREVLQADPEVYHGALDTIATMLRSLTGAKP